MSTGVCKDCLRGAIREGKATGREDTIHGLPCYVAEAPNGKPKGIIILLPDAFGWKFINMRILADTFAKKGQCQSISPRSDGRKIGRPYSPQLHGCLISAWVCRQCDEDVRNHCSYCVASLLIRNTASILSWCFGISYLSLR